MRGLPRSQVRSDQPERVLFLAAFFNNTSQGAKDGNIKDTPPIIVVPRPEDRQRAADLNAKIVETKQKAEARKPAARAEFDRWLASTSTAAIASLIPSDGLRLHALLGEGTGNTSSWRSTAVRKRWPSPRCRGGRGMSRRNRSGARAKVVAEVPEAGDFDKKQPFSYGAWIKVPKPSTSARSWPGWTISMTSAAGISGSRRENRHPHR